MRENIQNRKHQVEVKRFDDDLFALGEIVYAWTGPVRMNKTYFVFIAIVL